MYYEETANANPMVAIILGVVLLGENLNGTFLVGLGTLVVGVVFVNWYKKVHPE
jgi:drug/metabolite transporter (DMT)-like permease